MKTQIIFFTVLAAFLLSCSSESPRSIEDFNFDWKFHKGDLSGAESPEFSDSDWEVVQLPHDWSIRESYQKENTAASTGFVPGGIAWYRKSFTLPETDKGKVIWIEFDGVYCNSQVWINGHFLELRPNGYSSFSYQLAEHLNYGDKPNVIAVKADHSAYADTRWYTGSGIYRNVRLVKTSPLHIPQWGVQVTTSNISEEEASVHVKTKLGGTPGSNTRIELSIQNSLGEIVSKQSVPFSESEDIVEHNIEISNPKLWGVDNPNLYKAVVSIIADDKLMDQVETVFGIRSFRFDASKGFFLNGQSMKIKGVNLHHDAGAVGAAVPKGIWEYRVKKLKSIGVNAIRMSHNPHSVELMEVCDEMGMLVMDEFFDEWYVPKGKSVVYLGDNAAGEEISKGYSAVFFEWAERDLKDLIRRDFNHPSVIFWSIGNEIEWTFPDYSATYNEVEGQFSEYDDVPNYDTALINPIFIRITGGVDSLSIIAHQLAKWVKEMDTTRPVICGSVRPTIAFASGYADAVDVLGLNYRANDYDAAHEAFPDKCLIGSENWVAYSEWKSCIERDFIPGIFVWTGFAYLGEAGPWPRKGLNISLFDFAGFKNPRGHFFECLWKEEPKVYMVTTPASESEYSYTDEAGWKFEMQFTAPPVWSQLRKWEWYKVNEKWNYKSDDDIVVQAYTNCEEAELFLNGTSLGKQQLKDFTDDNIIKWLVPYEDGELKVVGYSQGAEKDEYILNTTGEVARIELSTDTKILSANNYDVAHVVVKLFDNQDLEIKDLDIPVNFNVEGEASILAVDNGWEMNVDSHYQNSVVTHNGKAIAIVQAGGKQGRASIRATSKNLASNVLVLDIK